MLHWILDILRGAVMGVSNIIPGVSGGTMAVSMGIYDRIIYAVNNIFKQFKKSFREILPILIGILIGLLILQVPLAIPLAALVFLLAFIPIVGATVAGILAALVALVANGWVVALIVVGVVVLVNQLEGNFLQPFLMGRSMKLHAFVVLVALTVGTVLGGILGAVLAVPITAVVWGAVQVWDGPSTPARWARPKPHEEEAGSPERWRMRKRTKEGPVARPTL